VGASTPAQLGVGLEVALEWEAAPVVHLFLLRHYRDLLWERAEQASRAAGVQGGEQQPHCRGQRVRILGAIHEVLGQCAQVEDGTALQAMNMSDYMMTYSLGAWKECACVSANMCVCFYMWVS